MFVTHSPFILSDVSNKNVLYLSKEERQPEKESFAANIYDLLDDHFFLDETIGGVALGKISAMVSLYRESMKRKGNTVTEYQSNSQFLLLEKDFRLLKDMVADSYLKQDLNRIYYELAAEYMPERLNDEIERTQQHLEELKALAKKEGK